MNQAYLFNTGKNYMSYNMLGSRPAVSAEGEAGYRFAVWAPAAVSVSVVGDFNEWNDQVHPLEVYGTTGIWVGFVPDAKTWERYKYAIRTSDGRTVFKADPYARHSETRPDTASILYDPDDYEWNDADYMRDRTDAYRLKPLNIYEVHLGSWRRYPDGSCYNYRDIAPQLADYVIDMGYTAIELMPIMEYPLDASWGYQVTGYFSATSRYGTPADLKYFIDHMHGRGIRVILDWVPGHFPRDAFGLARFDGSPLYEYADTRIGEHKDWGTLVFDYGKAEVRSFLLSSAYFWLDEFHFDGLRVDAVSSMVYLDYGRNEFVPNKYGGNENLEAIDFLKELNGMVREQYPSVLMIAEESSAFPDITKGIDRGGVGFTHKWNMGWMNDTLDYMSLDYLYRQYHHDQITFSMMYAFAERYILPFSHDEVVHGKKTLLGRMPGDYWRQFSSLRAVYMYQIAHPGAKLNFMGNEFAPYTEWRYYEELEWFMLQYPSHKQMQTFVKHLNHLYLEHRALWDVDDSWDGFQWLRVDDKNNSVLAWERIPSDPEGGRVIAVFNLTPAVLPEYWLDVNGEGRYQLLLNSDDVAFGGSGYLSDDEKHRVYRTYKIIPEETSEVNRKVSADSAKEDRDAIETEETKYRIKLTLPPLCGLFLTYDPKEEPVSDETMIIEEREVL